MRTRTSETMRTRASEATRTTIGPRLTDVIARLEAEDEEFRRARIEQAPSAAIARKVILARSRLGLTQQQLAEALHTSVPAISRLESGRHGMTVQTLQRVADVLSVEFSITPRAERPVAEVVAAHR